MIILLQIVLIISATLQASNVVGSKDSTSSAGIGAGTPNVVSGSVVDGNGSAVVFNYDEATGSSDAPSVTERSESMERDRKDQEYSSKVSENNESSCGGTKPIDRDYYMDEKLLGAITKTKTTGEFPNDEEIIEFVKVILQNSNWDKITMKMVSKIVYDKYPDYDLTIKETLIKDTIKYLIRQP
ncbi:protein DEK-like [Armigeres subalbatus]|uniref:protein DEK-like n=1 Tax=Armigeres subalbatus TaxID=124917 RepID=UPI002ED2C3BC